MGGGVGGTHLQELGADFKLGWLDAGLLGPHPPALDSLEQLVDGPRDDSLLVLAQTDVEARPHGEGLPRTRLKHSSQLLLHNPAILYFRFTIFSCLFHAE